jgi:mono/diheme cytochrome c family protein
MKLKLVVVLCCVAIGVFGSVSKTFANLDKKSGAQSKPTVSTRELYLNNCARCHGPDGRGQTPQGRKYEVPDLVVEAKDHSASKLTRVITNGKEDMPAFGKKLTRRQITALASYVRKL